MATTYSIGDRRRHYIVQKLTADEVHGLCRGYNLYTRGDSDAFQRMLDRVTEINMFTFDENGEQDSNSWNVDTYIEIATDIAEHSELEGLEGDEKMEEIAYLLMSITRRWIRTEYKGYDY